MKRLTGKLVRIGLALCLLLVGLLWALRGDWLQAVLAGITLAMGVLPQPFTTARWVPSPPSTIMARTPAACMISAARVESCVQARTGISAHTNAGSG